MIFAFMMKSFDECLEIHETTKNRITRRFALATMMAKGKVDRIRNSPRHCSKIKLKILLR